MTGNYELIEHKEGLYFKTFVTSVHRRLHHWHYDLEVLLILEGSIIIQQATERIELHQDDLFIINRNEIHGFKRTIEENSILALQIDPLFCREYYPAFNKIRFLEHHLSKENKPRGWDKIRQNLLDIFFTSNLSGTGNVFQMASHLNLLVFNLLQNVSFQQMEEESALVEEKNLERLNRIIGIIHDQFREKITLKELSQQENLDMFYLSHFIKSHLGISFQEYLNRLRLAKAVELMEKGEKNHLQICLDSGFSDYRYFLKMFLHEYGCQPAEYFDSGLTSNRGLIIISDDEEHIIYQPAEAKTKLSNYLVNEGFPS